MPTMSQETSENSVLFSLAELARIEEARVRDEEERRAGAREQEARDRREALARQRAAEEAQVSAQAEARSRRQREEAEEAMRTKAREQAAVEVARIQAEAKARLDAENAGRAHELDVLRVRTEGGHRRLQVALAVVLGLVVCGGPAAAYGVHRQVGALEQDNAQLHEGQTALSLERAQAKAAELAALDRRHSALRSRTILVTEAGATAEVRATAEAARNAIDANALDHNRLRAFGDALDGLQARIDGLEKLAALDRRHADLTAWAEQRRKSEVTAAAHSVAARARVLADEGTLRAYEAALDQLRDGLAEAVTKTGSAGTTQSSTKPGGCNDPHDPMCGFNGQRL
jgi:hypothetical protein